MKYDKLNKSTDHFLLNINFQMFIEYWQLELYSISLCVDDTLITCSVNKIERYLLLLSTRCVSLITGTHSLN